MRSLNRASSIHRLFRPLGGLAVLLAALLGSAPPAGAADTVTITEVVSQNSGGLADEDNGDVQLDYSAQAATSDSEAEASGRVGAMEEVDAFRRHARTAPV